MLEEAERALIDFRRSLTRTSLLAVLSSKAVHPTNVGEAIDLGLRLGLIAENEIEPRPELQPIRPREAGWPHWLDRRWNPLGGYRRALRSYRRETRAFEEAGIISGAWARAQTANFWRSADGEMFERLVARFFRREGWVVEILGGAGDGGIDLVMRRGAEHVVVQCKAHRRPLSPAVVRELYGALLHSGAQEAILATFDGVSSAARSWISDKPIKVLTLSHFVTASR